MTPTARTLKLCRDEGLLAESVEKYNTYTRRRHDLFNFIDVVAIGEDTIGIQTTTAGNLSKRESKIVTECNDQARRWIGAGNRIVLHGWAKKKIKRGGKAFRWECRIKELTAVCLAAPNYN